MLEKVVAVEMIKVKPSSVWHRVRDTGCGEEKAAKMRRQVQSRVQGSNCHILVDVSTVAGQVAVVRESVEHGTDTTG